MARASLSGRMLNDRGDSSLDTTMDAPSLPWTGERFIPNEGGPEIYYEHAHRYLLARELLAGTVVVDLASGEGYGAAWLAEVAESVVGVDIDDVSVKHARARYAQHGNLQFAVGDIQALPLADQCADAVTCFEAIEHVEDPRAVVEEVVRILRPGGLLLVSTPNKAVYADERAYENEFHVHEFYLPDLELLLGEYFAERDLVGQRVVGGSLTWRLAGLPEGGATGHGAGVLVAPGFGESGTCEPASMAEPMYVMAACRLEGPPRVGPSLPGASILVDPEELLLERYRQSEKTSDELHAEIRDRDSQLERARAQLAAYEEQATLLRRRIRELDEEPRGRDGGRPAEPTAESESLHATLLAHQQLAGRLSRDLDAATELNVRLIAELRAQQTVLARLQRPPVRPTRRSRRLPTVATRVAARLSSFTAVPGLVPAVPARLRAAARRARRLAGRP